MIVRGIEINGDYGFKLAVKMERYQRVSFTLMSPLTKPRGLYVSMPLDKAMDMVERVKRRAKELSLHGEYPGLYSMASRMPVEWNYGNAS